MFTPRKQSFFNNLIQLHEIMFGEIFNQKSAVSNALHYNVVLVEQERHRILRDSEAKIGRQRSGR